MFIHMELKSNNKNNFMVYMKFY